MNPLTPVFAQQPGAVMSDALTQHEAPSQPGAPSPASADTPSVDLTAALSRAVPLHYGDPAGEQWALEAGDALVDRTDLSVIEVSGADRHSWLTSLSTQIITGITAGESRELLILDPQGHIEHWAGAIDDTTSTYLITEGVNALEFCEWLNSMRFALRVTVTLREDLAVLGTAGHISRATGTAPQPPEIAHSTLRWDDPWPGVTDGGTEYHQGPHPAARYRAHLHILPTDALAQSVAQWLAVRGKTLAGLYAWEALRIAAWRPRLGYETDARAIPAESDWLRTAVHINKGCYRGQESVARVLNLGRPPRRLVFLQLDGSRGDLPQIGTPIERKGRQVGVITSVARHADEGPIALALIARNIPADEVFDLNGIAAAQELIVPIDGKAAASPEERPGQGLANPLLRRPDMRGPASGGLGPK